MPNSAYDQLFDLVGKNANVDPQLAKTVFHLESSGNPGTVDSEVGAQGPMQLMPPLQKHYGVTDPHKMEQAVPAAMAYLREGLDKTGTPAGALGYYFSGSANPASWGPKTLAYIAKGQSLYPSMAVNPTSQGTPAPVPQPAADPYLELGKALDAGSVPSGADANTVLQNLRTGGTAPAAAGASDGSADPYLALGRALDQQQSATPPPAQAAAAPPVAAPAAAPQGPMLGSPALQQFTEGTTQGVRDVSNTLARGVGAVNQAVPFLGRLDAATGIDPAAMQANLAARQQAFQASPAGQSLAGGAGRLVGQTAVTAPAMGPIGDAAGAGVNLLAQGAGRIAPVLGQATNALGDFIGGTASAPVGGSANAIVRGLSMGTQGALQGGALGAATSGQSNVPLATQVGMGALGGAVAGPVLGTLGAGGNALRTVATGGNLSSPRAKLADLAVNKYGLPLTVDQISQDPFTQKAGQMLRQLPMTGMGTKDLQAPFNAAVAKTFGADLSQSDGRFTAPVMQAAKKGLGQTFDAIAQRTTIVPDPQFLTDLGAVAQDAKRVLNPADYNRVTSAVSDIRDALQSNKGVIPGDVYQSLTRSNRPLDRLENSTDPDVAFYAQGVRNALDDAFQRSAGQSDQALLSQTRLQYKNMMTVAPLVAKSATGDISPALLNGRVTTSFGNRAFQGADDLGELAQIGQAFVTGPRDSGTPAGMRALKYLENPLAAVGAAGGSAYLSPLAAAAGAGTYGTAIAGQRLLAHQLQNPAVVNRLIQSGLGNPAATPMLNRLGAVIGPQLQPAAILAGQRFQGAGGTPP